MATKVGGRELCEGSAWRQGQWPAQCKVLQVLHAKAAQEVLRSNQTLGTLLPSFVREVPFLFRALTRDQRARTIRTE
ncbi:MAG: hypothetical protein WBL16_01125, partial [Zwartia sp.]